MKTALRIAVLLVIVLVVAGLTFYYNPLWWPIADPIPSMA